MSLTIVKSNNMIPKKNKSKNNMQSNNLTSVYTFKEITSAFQGDTCTILFIVTVFAKAKI